MIDLKDIDCSVFKYNPSKKKDLDKMMKEHMELRGPIYDNDDEFSLVDHHYNMLRYIILVYDRNSPLWTMQLDVAERKVTALTMIGYDVDEIGHFDYKIQHGVLHGKNRKLARMIAEYVFLSNNIEFVQLIGLVELNKQYLTDILNQKKPKEILKLFKDSAKDIDQKMQNLFHGKEMDAVETEILDLVAKRRMSYRPEDVAKRISNGERIVEKGADIYEKERSDAKVRRAHRHGDN